MDENIRYEKFLKNIGKNLQAVRVARKKDIDTVARVVGIRPDFLELIEKGECNWDIETFARLCRYYNVPVREIADCDSSD